MIQRILCVCAGRRSEEAVTSEGGGRQRRGERRHGGRAALPHAQLLIFVVFRRLQFAHFAHMLEIVLEPSEEHELDEGHDLGADDEADTVSV